MGKQWKVKGKSENASAKGRLFTRLAKEIQIAARSGADPDMNPRLRLAMDQAKKASMPKDTVERAVRKGAGLDAGAVNYEKLIYEGFAPHRVPVIVECLTDNNNRTVSAMRVAFRKGQLGASGSVSWDFDHLGMIEAVPETPDSDPELAAIEAGAQDLELGDEGSVTFYTEPTDLDAVCRALPAQGFIVQSARLGYRPKNPVSLGEAERAEVEAFLEGLDDADDVQNIYVGLAD